VTSEGAQYADTVLNKVNELRSGLGLQPVTRYQELDAVAQDWSEQQAAANNMSHRPDFTSVYPKGWTTGSENVAWRTAGGDTGALIFDQWLNSPGHYKNMTDPDVNSIGIGFAQTSDGRWYATQNFAAYNVSNTTLTQTTTSTTSIAGTRVVTCSTIPVPATAHTTTASSGLTRRNANEATIRVDQPNTATPSGSPSTTMGSTRNRNAPSAVAASTSRRRCASERSAIMVGKPIQGCAGATSVRGRGSPRTNPTPVLNPIRNYFREGRFGAMIRKLFWTILLLAGVCVATSLLDRRRAEQRRQLWAEATDPS